MFCKRLNLILLLIIATVFTVFPHTGVAATKKTVTNRAAVQTQINILIAKIKLLQAELEKIKQAEIKSIDLQAVNTSVRQAAVNILCQSDGSSPFRSISGSGVIIDPRGVILTNAHIAQNFLVADYPRAGAMNCKIRAGSPAKPAYLAKIMYLPPAWIQNNKKAITSSDATGTGEDDYALLAITGSATESPLPTTFPYVPVDDTIVDLPDRYPALLASYPGELVGSIIIMRELSLVSATTDIVKGYYFETDNEKYLDLLDVSGTVLSQAGSSGGAVVSLVTGKLVGIMATATEGKTTSSRELRAITLAHVNRSMIKYLNQSLATFLQQVPSSAAYNFDSTTAPLERATLIQQ